jgi:tetratricopeptide (TPR) repeat protein
MFGFGWLTLRQVQEALQTGRLEEAQRLLEQPGVLGQRGAGAILVRLARAYIERGERLLRQDDAEGAWRDLHRAEQLETAERGGERLRQALTRLGLAEVRALLQAGEAARASDALARLRGHDARSPELSVLDEAIKAWLAARTQADNGEYTLALDTLERVARLLGATGPGLETYRLELIRRRDVFAALVQQLHDAAAAGRWREVNDLAEQVLRIAPQHAQAREARVRAWKAVQPPTVAAVTTVPEPSGSKELAPRYLLWVDGVGGYLICMGNRLVLGQAGLEGRADIPLVADIARLHAVLTRDTEGTVIEAMRDLRVNGRPVTRALLRANDRLTLGATCQLQFRLPVPVSTTIRLDVTSGHRLPLALDGVLLMSETLLLGPGPQAHVVVPNLTQTIVLFRNKDGLGLRHTGKLTVDGQAQPERGLLGPHAVIASDEVTFALEPVTKL